MESYNPNDYYVQCDQGHPHWGAEGAAGLMLHHQDENGIHRYLMQQRSPYVEHGDTWAPPAGALAPGERPEQGAVREAQEELGRFPSSNHQVAHVNDHGGWAFHTVSADTPYMFDPELNEESQDAAWLTPEEIDELPLHPDFRESWKDLRPTPKQRMAAYVPWDGELKDWEPGRWGTTSARKISVSNEELEAQLNSWFQPKQLEQQFTHPETGFGVTYGDRYRLAPAPGATPQQPYPPGVNEWPAEWAVDDHLPQDHQGYRFPNRDVRREPIEHVYRAVHPDEWAQAQQRGYLQSDQRGTISDWEGTNAGLDPRTAWSYLPRGQYGNSGHILKIRTHPDDGWFATPHDDYVRTRNQIPLDRVEAVSPLIETHNQDAAMGQPLMPRRTSAVFAPPVPELYHWTDASNLHDWMNPASNGPGSTYLTEHGDAPDDESWNPDVPMMQNPVRLTIDHSQLDPDGWDDQYHGWLNNYLYHGPIPKSAIKGIKAFPPADSWAMPEHWAKKLADSNPWASSPDSTPPPTGTDMAVAHTGRIPGDEQFMHDNIFDYEHNPNSGVNPSYIGQMADPNDETDPGMGVYVKPAGLFHDNDLVHERAAFGLAHELGISMPHTVVRKIPRPDQQLESQWPAPEGVEEPEQYTYAQIQEAIPGAKSLFSSHSPQMAAEEWPEESRRIGLFDNIIGNHDRHMGNVIQGDNGSIYPIDHGGAFLNPDIYSPYGFSKHYEGAPLSEDERKLLERVHDHDLTQYGLEPHEIKGVHARVRQMLQYGRMLGEPVDDNYTPEYGYDQLKDKGYALRDAPQAYNAADQFMRDHLRDENIRKHVEAESGLNGPSHNVHDDAMWYKGRDPQMLWAEAYHEALAGRMEARSRDFEPDEKMLPEKLRHHLLQHFDRGTI